MDLVITYGALALFFAVVVIILQRSYVADRDFTVCRRRPLVRRLLSGDGLSQHGPARLRLSWYVRLHRGPP
jgi:hypothetical protein